MFWWSDLLFCVGMGIAGIPIGFVIFKVWNWYDSRKAEAPVSDNRAKKSDILVEESRNQYQEGIQLFTIPAKSEAQNLSFAYESKHPITKQETRLQVNHYAEEIVKSAVVDKMGQDIKLVENQEKIPAKKDWTDNKFVSKSRSGVNQSETLFVSKDEEFTRGKSQLILEVEASTRKYQEAKAKMLMEIERMIRGETLKATGEEVKEVEREGEIVRKNQELKTAGISGQAVILNEIEMNLRIATTPWNGKPLPFQTKIWDTKMVEFDSLDTEHSDDLRQAYIDMIMANVIVWFCTEISHASDDLEASYKQLCNKIAERLDRVFSKIHSPCYV